MSDDVRIIDTYPQRGHSKIPGGPPTGREGQYATLKGWLVGRYERNARGMIELVFKAGFEVEQDAEREQRRLMEQASGENQETPAARRVREFLARQAGGVEAEQPGDIPKQAAERNGRGVSGGKVVRLAGPGSRVPDGRVKGSDVSKRRGRSGGSE
jgi:hypothetical protein